MHPPRILKSVPVLILGLVSWFCADEGVPADNFPVIPEKMVVSLSPGRSSTVVIAGGTPPYQVTRYPDANVASAILIDPTMSPASLFVSVSPGAIVGDSTVILVDDSNPLNRTEVSISVHVVAVVNASFSNDIQPIFDGNCRNRGCHPGGGSPFSLADSVSYQNLFYSAVNNMSCGVVFRVVPFYSDSSLLYLLVSGRTSCPRMPYSPLNPGDTLSLEDQVTIHDWIVQGAVNN